MTTDYTISDISARSPDMKEKDFRAFVEDIRATGQLVPIWVNGSEVIDGRKRLAACRELGIEPKVVNLDPEQDAEAVARALNVLRTHYSPSQRAIFASERANATKGDGTKIRDGTIGIFTNGAVATTRGAAREAGVAQSAVVNAKRVRRDGAPEVVAAVKAGRLTLHAATEIINLVPKDEQPAIVEQVIEASKGKARHTPVSKILTGANPLKRRFISKPAPEQFARAVQMMDVAVEIITATSHAAENDVRRKEFLDTLRHVRRSISRVITSLEIAA